MCEKSGEGRKGFQLVEVWQFSHASLISPCGLAVGPRWGDCPAPEDAATRNTRGSSRISAAIRGIPAHRAFFRQCESTVQSPFTLFAAVRFSRRPRNVTSGAGTRQPPIGDDPHSVRSVGGFMTGCAGGGPVRTGQSIARLGVVIEKRRFPFLVVVAAGAIRRARNGELTAVLVVMA